MYINKKLRNLFHVGIGVAGLLSSRYYSGPIKDFFHSYGANISFSFAAYFLLKFFRLPLINNKYMNAAYTLFGDSVQEFVQSVGIYPGTYDPLDFIFNAIGIGIALVIDLLRIKKNRNVIQKNS